MAGALAQLGERLLCKHQVIGSIPIGSTTARSKGRAPSVPRGLARRASELSDFPDDEDTGSSRRREVLGRDGPL